MIKYLGSKRLLVPLIQRLAAGLPITSACDLFAGTTRVGQALRANGLHVHSNDLATYSEVLAQAYIVADETLDRPRLSAILDELSRLEGEDGYVSEVFCRRARYFQVHNGRRIDAIRDAIERYPLSAVERGIVLTSLLEAADRVDSTAGLQMAYLKEWAPRSHNALELRLPSSVSGPAGSSSRLDANALAAGLDVDLVYVDPPYNQHSFFSNYHVWETIVRWDFPESYGVAHKRIDCRERRSAYNSKRGAPAALAELLESLRAPWLIVSASDEGFHSLDELQELLEARGAVARIDIDSKRYVGAQIGIYNPSGEKVGAVSHLRNRECLFLAGPDRGLVERLAREAHTGGAVRAGARASTAVVSKAAASSGSRGAEGARRSVPASSPQPPSAAGQRPRPRR
jgi:adenine-specific DNA-methyltransferase